MRVKPQLVGTKWTCEEPKLHCLSHVDFSCIDVPSAWMFTVNTSKQQTKCVKNLYTEVDWWKMTEVDY